ncbi:Hypothetical protein Tpal_1086 [Trichococcus palustris]|jgi:hypothetical protein|uniref:Uncharacterized protein n=1 Tax=Trichococcus palustris TaxID=140314 RepID=A0A143YI12_9LACT|nr:Hypothetical protein Tpal_1086 [Trichococcus palustris]
MEEFDQFVDVVAEQMLALWHHLDPTEDTMI